MKTREEAKSSNFISQSDPVDKFMTSEGGQYSSSGMNKLSCCNVLSIVHSLGAPPPKPKKQFSSLGVKYLLKSLSIILLRTVKITISAGSVAF